MQVKWFKLGLEAENEILTLPAGLTAADVVRDYLSAIYKHVMTTLYRRFERGVLQLTKIDFVLTVPAIWSDAAKKKTEDAAIRAGMGNEHTLELLSEPESAAVYTLKNLDNNHSQIRVHDRIVVCDAGGGTVDLISYDIQSIHPSLSVMECAAGTGNCKCDEINWYMTKATIQAITVDPPSLIVNLRNCSLKEWGSITPKLQLSIANKLSRTLRQQRWLSETTLPSPHFM